MKKSFSRIFKRKSQGEALSRIPAKLAVECMEFVARHFGNNQNIDVVQATLNGYLELSPEDQSEHFGRMYFRLENFIVGLSMAQSITGERIRSRLFREVPEAAEYAPFDLCPHTVEMQEFLLCRSFLLLLCTRGCEQEKRIENRFFKEMITWLEGNNEHPVWPPPIKVLQAEPDTVVEWTHALESCNNQIQLRLKTSLGGFEMLDLYERAFEVSSGIYKGLRSFSVVYGLLPSILLDEEKMAILEGRQALQERLSHLEDTNLELTSANNALQHTKRALSRAQEEAESAATLVRKLLDTAGEAIFGIKSDGEILFANELAATTWGYPIASLGYMNFLELLDQESAEFFREYAGSDAILNEESSWLVMTGCRDDGTYIPLKVHMNHTRDSEIDMITVSIRDLTDTLKKEQEEEELRNKLENAERMESIGLLAGGVAHDLNNILGPLVVYPELILEVLDKDHEVREDVEEIGKSARRAAAIIQDLLTMSRQGHYEFKAVNLNKVVQSFLSSPEFKNPMEEAKNLVLEVNLGANCPMIKGSDHHLLKIFLNLCINAMDAMPVGGSLSISTAFMRDAEGGEDWVVCKVRDSGEGIPQEHIKRIFEPFYSTKKLGRSGSGLGLSVVYGVIKDLGGDLEVQSEVGVGTEFLMKFPVVYAEDEEAAVVVEEEPTGTEHILVVDDDVAQLKLATRLFSSLGYTVDCVTSGRSAIDFLQQTKVDFVVLDMMIEDGFDGLDTFQIIREYWPGIVCMIVSGYSESDRVAQALQLGAVGFVKKPYAKGELALRVRHALDHAAADSNRA